MVVDLRVVGSKLPCSLFSIGRRSDDTLSHIDHPHENDNSGRISEISDIRSARKLDPIHLVAVESVKSVILEQADGGPASVKSVK